MSEMKKYLKTIKFEKYLDLLVTKLYGKRVLIYGAGLLFETAFKNYNFKGLNIIGISDKKFEDKNSPEKFYDIKTYTREFKLMSENLFYDKKFITKS